MTKKTLSIIIILLLTTNNVFADEIQLTDYSFAYGKRVYDGFSVVALSKKGCRLEDKSGKRCGKVEEVYLKPNGTQLYYSNDYDTGYGKNDDLIESKIRIGFWQSPEKKIATFNAIQPYLPNYMSSMTMTIFDYNGNIMYSGIVDIDKIMQINGTSVKQDEWDAIVDADLETEESQNERVDRSYSFREKQINGQTYYALFKELKDGETAADFMPTEQSTPKYSEYINQMYKKGLLFNNEMCFYKRGITRLDFGIVLGRAYCNATGYSIDKFTTDTHFVDVNNPYCLYLADNGILTSSNALGYNLYLNEKEITKKDVSDALDKAAEKCGVLTEWKNTKVIQPTDAVCSRELAYVETFRLYELIKKHNNPNYSAFTPSQVLDSDSEAETMHYETVAYNASNAETSTEMTTQATAVSGGSTSKITVASIISSVVAVFAGIIAAAQG